MKSRNYCSFIWEWPMQIEADPTGRERSLCLCKCFEYSKFLWKKMKCEYIEISVFQVYRKKRWKKCILTGKKFRKVIASKTWFWFSETIRSFFCFCFSLNLYDMKRKKKKGVHQTSTCFKFLDIGTKNTQCLCAAQTFNIDSICITRCLWKGFFPKS